jgi:hypothetical protein
MPKIVNRAYMSTATTGTGTITLGSPLSGYQSFAAAGVTDGDEIRYVIEDGTSWEIGTGTYTATGTTLTRTVSESSSGGTAIALSGSAVVFVTATNADFREESVGTITGTTVNLDTGNVFSDAPATSTTYVFSNPPATGTAYGFTLKITPSAGVTITWPASVDWPGGIVPDAPDSGETDVFVFYTQDGGTTYYGFQAGDGMA